MKLGRIFANAIVRRLAYVLVAAALAWVGLGDARAQTCSTSGNVNADMCPDQGSAYSAVIAAATDFVGGRPGYCLGPATVSGNGYILWVRIGANCDANHKLYSRSFPASTACSSRPDGTFSSDIAIPFGSSGCSNGCEYDVSSNGDGTYTRNFDTAGNAMCSVLPNCTTPGWYLNHATSLCQPPNEECDENEIRSSQTGQCEPACPSGMVADASGVCKPSEDDCPAGNTRSPGGQCLPGEGQCAAGEARRPNGTCGRDSDGDGQADEDDEDPENDPDRETASGGDSCSAPPSCSGGPIDCMQVKIQWRIDCNTRSKVNITGGACSAMPVCVGENCNAMEYAQLVQQWKAACALEGLDLGEGEAGNNQDLIDLLTDPGTIEGSYGDTGGMPGGNGFEFGDTDVPEPDTSGYGYGSSCPSPPSFTVYGQTISINLTPMCNWVGLAGNLVLILAALASMRIVSGGTA